MATLIKYSLLDGQARAHIVSAADIVAEARRVHDASRVAAAALGRMLMAGVLLSDQLKSAEHKLTLTADGGGPLGRVIVTAYGGGFVKGYAENPTAELPPRPDGKLDVGGAVGRSGHLTLVSDLLMKEPYISRTALVSGEIAEDMAHLLAVSMQRPAAVALGAILDGQSVQGAGGALIEPLPGASGEAMDALRARLSNLEHISAKARDAADAEALGLVLLEGLEPIALDVSHPAYACDCSRGRLERVLMSMGRGELEDIIATQGGAELTCHFCNERYNFTEEDLRRIIGI